MQFSLYINQEMAVEWDLTANQSMVFDFILKAASWAERHPDNAEFYWVSKGKIAEEMPLVCSKPASAQRIVTQLTEKGLLERTLFKNRSYYMVTKKGLRWISDTLSKDSPSATPKGKRVARQPPQGSPVSHPRGGSSATRSVNQLSNNQLSVKDTAKPKKQAGKSTACWDAYSSAFQRRHGAPPLRDASINSMLCKFVDKIPNGNAARVAEFYVSHNGKFYVDQRHPVNLLLRDAQKIHTDWLNNSSGGQSGETPDQRAERMDAERRSRQNLEVVSEQ